MSDDDQAVNALRRIRAAVRAGISPTRRPRRQPGPTPLQFNDARDPKLVSAALDEFLITSGLDTRSQVAQVLSNWTELVGAEVADHVQPQSFDDGKLVLRADSTAWATQMRLLQATVQRRLNEQVGENTVTEIQVLGPDGPSWRFGQRHVPGRGPRDTYG